jgi:hypothetical protein
MLCDRIGPGLEDGDEHDYGQERLPGAQDDLAVFL